MIPIISPSSLTILPTYKCNAACEQCCFQSSPMISEKLPREVIRTRISEAVDVFHDLRQVIFSGGEALLLKDDLQNIIEHAKDSGLSTRLVSNGFWGKREETALAIALKLKESGLSELNISTGIDHQSFVPENSAIQAAIAAARSGITTLITVEMDSLQSSRIESLLKDSRIAALRGGGLIGVISNSWMPFLESEPARHSTEDIQGLKRGCSQLFRNITVKPNDRLSACCGLTMERIPEMDLGKCNGTNMESLHNSQLDDLMKIWIYLEGPYRIIERSINGNCKDLLDGVVHICQACAILHRNPFVAALAKRVASNEAKELITRFTMRVASENLLNRAQRDFEK